jgi:glycosyltransferase involved in cell wall biosynthesis
MSSRDQGAAPDGASPAGAPPPPDGSRPVIEVVLPVFDEERRLESGVRGLRAFLDGAFGDRALVTIVDNGSTDATPALGRRLAEQLDGVRMLRIEEKGRGRALRAAWSASRSPVVAYMDIDLSTGLDSFVPLVAPLLDGSRDLMVGSRLAGQSKVVRSLRREILSRGYNLLVRLFLGRTVSDAQCGFKAVRRQAIEHLLPLVADDGWFFDTELLVAARRRGYRIGEVPVTWVENADSRVRLWKTTVRDLQGIARLVRHPVPRWVVAGSGSVTGAWPTGAAGGKAGTAPAPAPTRDRPAAVPHPSVPEESLPAVGVSE